MATHPKIEVRVSSESDSASLSTLRSVFWSDQIAKGSIDYPNIESDRLLADTASLIKRVRTIAFVAVSGDKLVGYIIGQTRILPGAAGSVISSIEEIFVEPECRHSPLACNLVERVMLVFKTAGANRVQLRVLESNDDAKKFWQRMGFLPSVTIYEYMKTGNSTSG